MEHQPWDGSELFTIYDWCKRQFIKGRFAWQWLPLTNDNQLSWISSQPPPPPPPAPPPPAAMEAVEEEGEKEEEEEEEELPPPAARGSPPPAANHKFKLVFASTSFSHPFKCFISPGFQLTPFIGYSKSCDLIQS